jgi:hypothetical protein
VGNQQCVVSFHFKGGHTVAYRMSAALAERLLQGWRARPHGTTTLWPVETMDGQQMAIEVQKSDLFSIEAIGSC